MQPVLLGAALELSNFSKVESSASGTTTEVSDPASVLGLKLYVPWTATPSITVLPEFNYQTYTVFNTASFESISGWSLDVAARFQF
ncbi:MAG: hypothetical protein HC902_12020 [Calothrix sp. SM1_5_4]|nr:hypothetical protein [Calothrix sp. SM1_5_4]